MGIWSNKMIMEQFDYMYYRIARWYEEKGDSIYQQTGILLLIVFQCFTIMSLGVIISFIVNISFNVEVKLIALFGLIVIAAFNFKRYTEKYHVELKKKWDNTVVGNSTKKGWFIVYSLVGVVLFPIFIGILRHNFGIDI